MLLRSHRERTYFHFDVNLWYICYLVHIFPPPHGTVMLAVFTSYLIGAFSDLYVGSGLRLQPRRETR
jgi:hypothetical protein